MIQATPIIAISEAHDAVIWPILNLSKVLSVFGITRSVMICSLDGVDDVTLDSVDQPTAYDFNYQASVRGQSVPAILWQPGLAMGESFQQLGLYKVRLFLYDDVHQIGVYCGEFLLLVKSIRLYRYVTSRPYPVLDIQSVGMSATLKSYQFWQSPSDSADQLTSIVSIDLRLALHSYAGLPENIDMLTSIVSAEIRAGLVTYLNWPSEGADHSTSLISGSIRVGLITYSNYPPESIDQSTSLISGSLT